MMSSLTSRPRGLNRRQFLIAGAGLLAGLPACTHGHPLRIALHPWAGYQFILLAREEGGLPETDLELVETAILSDSARALAEGRVEGAALTLDEVLVLRARGLPLRVALIFDVSAGADALLTRPDLPDLASLRGRRLGVEDSTLGAIMLHEVLRASGLTRTDLDIVPMTVEHVAAWERGDLDALLTYEPALSRLETRGLIRRFDSRRMPQRIIDVLAIQPEAAARHAGALRALLAGHFRALGQWQRNPIDTAYRLAARLGVGSEEVRRILGGLDLPDLIYNRQYLAPPATILTQAATALTAILVESGVLPEAPALDQLFVADYLPGAGE